MFTVRKRMAAIAGAGLIGAVFALSGAAPAQAYLGGSLPPNSTVCTQQIRSDRGMAFYGGIQAPVVDAVALWTVSVSSTAGGPETTLLRLTTDEPSTTYVSWPGAFYYRMCVTNTNSVTGALRFQFFSQPGNTVSAAAGDYTAVLGAGGSYCAPLTTVAARLVGTSTRPVQWAARVENFNADFLRTEDYGTSAAIDRAVTPGDDEIFRACATNTSGAAATLSFNFR